jgi:GTP-binding protein
MLKITNATFVTSAAQKAQFLKPNKPMIAVCGKSNVGKSSFINMLAGQRKLARVSQEPGRTRLVNYFDFGSFILADLPGYGYARVSKEEKAKWAKMLDDFFAEKDQLTHVFALCDIRHDPTADDRQMLQYLYYNMIPFTVIATKADKLSRMQVGKSVQNIATVYGCGKGDIIPTSAQTKTGYAEVIAKIEQVIATANGADDNDDDCADGENEE